MNPKDPNIAQVELVAAALGELTKRVVLVGGCAAGLLISDSAQPPIRVTFDVDIVTATTGVLEFYAIEDQLRSLGFRQDMRDGAPKCRYVVNGVIVDVMPASETEESNRWYREAITSASEIRLPSGNTIRLISAPAFIATKLVAFENRGGGDFAASHDIEDVLAVLDGREEALSELSAANKDLRIYIASTIRGFMGEQRFIDAVAGFFYSGEYSRTREPILLGRLKAIAES